MDFPRIYAPKTHVYGLRIMDKVEFLLKCVQDGKMSSGQACALLGNSEMPISEPAAVTTGALKQPIQS